MNKRIAAITGVGGWVPEDKLTNEDLEKMVDTNDAWIVERTGIKERRILKGENLGTSDMLVHAVRDLLTRTNTRPEEVDLLVLATVTPDMVVPDTANTVCDKVGLTRAVGFDINAACSGFIFALVTGAQFILAGTYKKVIVAGGDKMSSIVDYTDRTTAILFGDAAGAVMLELSEDGNGIIDHIIRGDGSGRNLLHLKGGGSLFPATHETVDAKMHYVYQEGKQVFKYAVRGMSSSIMELLERNDLTKEDIHWVVPHQANMRIIKSVAHELDLPIEKVTINIHKYGNTTAATIPLCLWEWQHTFKRGDNILLTAFGGGFTWGTVYLKWSI